MLVERTQDWRYVFAKYDRITDRMPTIYDLVYVSYVGIFEVDNVHNNGDIDVRDGERYFRFPTSQYRLIERKEK
ncbi:hypothetical protein J2Y67_004102 [Neobacillus niacini]|nr:hypothetical protein [Neobacillus niacini]